jgi:hypothetical protein
MPNCEHNDVAGIMVVDRHLWQAGKIGNAWDLTADPNCSELPTIMRIEPFSGRKSQLLSTQILAEKSLQQLLLLSN